MIQIDNLPDLPGVYFFYNQFDDLIYVGKSIHIKSRVKQHFSGKDRKSIKIQINTKRIGFEVMGSELIALLYESHLIKKHQPIYNRSQRRSIFQYGLYLDKTAGYKSLLIKKVSSESNEISSYSSMREAKNALFAITETYGLCQKINGLYKTSGACFQFQIKCCQGACIGGETPHSYNKRVEQFLQKMIIGKFTYLFEVDGRNEQEKGLVYIENGIYKGFGFCSLDTPNSKYLDYITPYTDNKDVRQILMRYLIRLRD